MKKEKITWWKILLGVLVLPFTVMYFVFKYLYKFYRSNRFTAKQKTIYTVIAFAIVCVFGAVNAMSKGPELEKVIIDDLTIYKDESKKVELTLTPKTANTREIKFVDYDDAVISVKDGKIKGLKEGQTSIVCEVIDEHSNLVKSNKFNVTVNLTEEQIAEVNAKAAEETAKAERELQEKRNTISSTESITIKDYCKEIIDNILKAPSTAEYPGSWLNPLDGWEMAKRNNLVTVKSYVDAQNSFGAMIRSEFIIQIQMQDDGSGRATYIQLNDEIISGNYQ